MECEGTVSKVDPYYGYFEVDNKFRVHLSLLKAHKRKTKLPALGSKMKATNLHKSSSTFVACDTTSLNGDFNVDFEPNSFINLIQNKLGAADMIVIDKTINMLDENFKFENDLKELVTVSLFEKIIELKGRKRDKSVKFCANNVLGRVDVISISSCKYIEVISNEFEQFPPWSFGIHPKQSRDSVLFGLVSIHSQYGLLMFRDSFHKMVCIVTNKTANMDHLENCYIAVMDYRIITEVFKDSNEPNLEYLIINFNDITVIHSLEIETNLFGIVPPMEDFSHCLEFDICRKSTICIGSRKNQEIYLEIWIKNDLNTEKVFVTLPSDYTMMVGHLKEGYKYKLFHNDPLVSISIPEFSQIGNFKKMKLVDRQAYFQELAIVDNDTNKTLTIDECGGYIKNNSKLFTFEGVIRNRGFVKKFNQLHLRTKTYGFSTPGKKNHTVTFSGSTEDKDLTLYLSDWINRLMPLGLVPQMRVKVKHVLPKPTYMKATIFTTIEILSYEPSISFQAANLYKNHDYDWGTPFYLSLGNKIPHGVIVWSRVQNIHILDVKMTNHCGNCEVLIEAVGACIRCGQLERKMSFALIMHTSDEFGLSRVTVKNPKFLRLVLDLSEKQFAVWMQAFENVGSYFFNIHDQGDDRFNVLSEPNYFNNILTELIVQFNNTLVDVFEVKCRKKYTASKKLKKYECPQWFYLDARKVFR